MRQGKAEAERKTSTRRLAEGGVEAIFLIEPSHLTNEITRVDEGKVGQGNLLQRGVDELDHGGAGRGIPGSHADRSGIVVNEEIAKLRSG